MVSAKLLELVKRYWPYVLVLLVGVGIGWGVKPDVVKIEEREKIVEVVKKDTRIDELLKQVASLREEVAKSKDATVNEKYHKEIIETVATDGSKTKKTTIDKNVDSHTVETETKTVVQVVEVEKQVVVVQKETVTQVVEKEKIVTPMLAQWHVGILAGVKPNINPLTSGGLQLGAEVERRIVGPIFLGIQVGASPTNFDGVLVMGKVGFEF